MGLSAGISGRDVAIIEGCTKAAGELIARVQKDLADEIKTLREEIEALRQEVAALKGPQLRSVA